MYFNYATALANDEAITVCCAVASGLVPRYLERIADHACNIDDSVIYVVTAAKS